MKNIRITALAAALLMSGAMADAQELVVRIDDMGALHSVNKASIDTYRNGIATTVEVIAVGSWFPEAVKMLKENPGLDAGVHLAITSEWENVKWRPLTHCPSLVDENGYFFPMLGPNPAYPGQSIFENMKNFDIKEIENEFRAQIELALRNIPQLTHISGHMMSTCYCPEVNELAVRLSEEYGLVLLDRSDSGLQYGYEYIGYDGPKRTSEEKAESFIKALDKMEAGKRYLFLDHPAYNDTEMETVMHIGYEDVAIDRQGVTDLLTNPEVRKEIERRGIQLIDVNHMARQLPRAQTPHAMVKAATKFLADVEKAGQDLHSIMIIKDGNVIYEKWMSEGEETKPHILNSVSKTFCATAVGFAINEGLLSLDDKVADFFPDKLPENASENLLKINVRHLLTMSCGHAADPLYKMRESGETDWIRYFLAVPVEYEPGTVYCYNSLGTYMLSAMVQKVTGQKIADYLYPRLFRPLGINNVSWLESPDGINAGGWGLYLKTEDLAKMGLLFLQNGLWNGKQIIPAEWIQEASKAQVASVPAGINSKLLPQLKKAVKNSDWLQGYGYQMWRCRNNAYRADGANGQYIIVLPEKNAVIAVTSHVNDMQAQMNLFWKHLLPAL